MRKVAVPVFNNVAIQVSTGKAENKEDKLNEENFNSGVLD